MCQLPSIEGNESTKVVTRVQACEATKAVTISCVGYLQNCKATKAVTRVSYLQGCEATKAVTHDCDGFCKATKAVTHVIQH